MLERLMKSLAGRMKAFHINEPSEIASWFWFFGGLAICFGRGVAAGVDCPFTGDAATGVGAAVAFKSAGVFVIVFAAVYYLMGWWRERF